MCSMTGFWDERTIALARSAAAACSEQVPVRVLALRTSYFLVAWLPQEVHYPRPLDQIKKTSTRSFLFGADERT